MMGFLLYNQHKLWYKAITIILVLALIVMISIGIAPRAKAVVGVATVVVSAVMAAMAAFGIGTIVSGMTSSQIEDYIGGKLQDWATSVGSPLDTLINSSLIGKTASSVFAIGAAAANGIRDFINWLTTDLSLSDNDSSIEVLDNATFGGVEMNEIYSFSYTGYTYETYQSIITVSQSPIYVYAREYTNAQVLGFNINMWCESPFTVFYNRGNTTDQYSSLQSTNGFYQYSTGFFYYSKVINGVPYTNNNPYITYNEIQQVSSQIPTSAESINFISGTIDIPNSVANEDNLYIDVGAPSVADVAGLADYVLDQVADNQLVSDYEIAEAPPIPSVGDINVDSYSPGAISQIQQAIQASIQSALANAGTIEVELVNDTPLSVNTDHHAFGFDLPAITFNFASIWHYVSDAVSYSSSFISWFVSLFTSVPILAIPLYCCFTLVVVLGAFRRFLL